MTGLFAASRRTLYGKSRSLVALGAVALAGTLVPSASASAAGGLGTASRTFTYTGAEQTFTVPAGVFVLEVRAVGGSGGDVPEGGAGGAAAQASGALRVTPGEALYIEVGGHGGEGERVNWGGFDGGAGGAGGGGGASDVRTSPLASGLAPDDRLIVAGGGGGGGASGVDAGGSGGSAGRPGANAAGRNLGGAAGTHGAPGGLGGCVSGKAGRLGGGGAGGNCGFGPAGGGGGGGYIGGGGGGGGSSIAGGGGGGGSSLEPAGGSVVLASLITQPEVQISYLEPALNTAALTTGAASAITQTSATLNATVNPEGGGVSSCYFEYGTSEEYGSTAPCTSPLGSGQNPPAVSVSVGNLDPNTTYHFRAVGINLGGASYGGDQSFTTLKKTPASPPGSGNGWGGVGGLSLPGPSWKPYANTSPFNQSAAGAAEHPESQAIVKTVLSWGLPENLEAGNAETSEDWGHPTFWAQPGDPIYTLEATEQLGPGNSLSLSGGSIKIPEYARPARGGDGHMTVVEPNGEEYDFWRAQAPPPGGGTFTFAWGNLVPGGLKGNGIGGGGTASGFGNLAGMIRAPELAAGHINHALFIVLKCAAPGTGFGDGAALDPPNSSYVYPANEGGSACPAGESDAPPLGTRFMLAMSDAQIKALAVPSWKKTILTALAEYGGYFGDTGGPGFTFMFESSTTYTALNLPDPLVEFAQKNDLRSWEGRYIFNVASGVEWEKYLRVLVPPSQ